MNSLHRAFLIMGICLIILAICAPARAGLFDVETKITASDAEEDEEFGFSVAISGSSAILGARFDDDGGTRSGSAYVFNVTTGNQLFKLTASDAAAYDFFGSSVAISGNTAIVGAYGDDDDGDYSGSAYLFDLTTGNQIFKLTASDAAEYESFGFSVAISGNTAIVGTFDSISLDVIGSAYVFDVTTGNELFKLTPSDGEEYDYFGVSVALSGNTAIVGAYGDDDAGSASGSAYLFDVTTGQQLFKLMASDAAAFDFFGLSVAISDNTAIVAADNKDDSGVNSGAAYLFDVTTGQQLFKLTPNDPATNDRFGRSVAISGNWAIVGADNNDDAGSDSGSAYVFDVTTGSQLFKLTASDASLKDYFGNSVAISGNRAIVGARYEDDGGDNAGSAYIYTPEPSSFALTALGVLGLASFARCRRRSLTA